MHFSQSNAFLTKIGLVLTRHTSHECVANNAIGLFNDCTVLIAAGTLQIDHIQFFPVQFYFSRTYCSKYNAVAHTVCRISYLNKNHFAVLWNMLCTDIFLKQICMLLDQFNFKYLSGLFTKNACTCYSIKCICSDQFCII